jgi:hypothetical protein
MNVRQLAFICTATVLLAACTRQETAREIDWAKAALARNPDFEIVATDETSGVFTVKDTATGTVRTLKLRDLIATPLAPREAAQPAASEPAASERAADTPDLAAAAEQPAIPADQTTATEAVEAVQPGNGASLAEGPGYSITRGTGSKPEAVAATLEGPGYRIEKQETPRHVQAAARNTPPANVERRTDPIICQGNRLMHIDGETIEFTGDAVIAERGCDLYISNARIRAGGVGIIARQARVHIVNSTIGGIRGSYEAAEGGEIYVARSTFEGVGRRFDGGTMTDLGGNSYATR